MAKLLFIYVEQRTQPPGPHAMMDHYCSLCITPNMLLNLDGRIGSQQAKCHISKELSEDLIKDPHPAANLMAPRNGEYAKKSATHGSVPSVVNAKCEQFETTRPPLQH